jgi:hypothetical protein
MRYLDLLSDTRTTTDRTIETIESAEQAPDITLYERTKKGGRLTWLSPTYGPCSGKLLMAPGDGWVLVQGEHTPELLVWVREDLLHAAR